VRRQLYLIRCFFHVSDRGGSKASRKSGGGGGGGASSGGVGGGKKLGLGGVDVSELSGPPLQIAAASLKNSLRTTSCSQFVTFKDRSS
jgi:hypothetical protein